MAIETQYDRMRYKNISDSPKLSEKATEILEAMYSSHDDMLIIDMNKIEHIVQTAVKVFHVSIDDEQGIELLENAIDELLRFGFIENTEVGKYFITPKGREHVEKERANK